MILTAATHTSLCLTLAKNMSCGSASSNPSQSPSTAETWPVSNQHMQHLIMYLASAAAVPTLIAVLLSLPSS
jgi:hypothetical protein